MQLLLLQYIIYQNKINPTLIDIENWNRIFPLKCYMVLYKLVDEICIRVGFNAFFGKAYIKTVHQSIMAKFFT